MGVVCTIGQIGRSRPLRREKIGEKTMRAKDILEICEELEDLAAVGKALTNGTVPDGEVAVTEENRRLLALFGLMWSIRP